MPSKRTPQHEPVLSVVARKVGRAAGTLTHIAETLVGKKPAQIAHSSPDQTATKSASKPSEVSPKETKSHIPASLPTRRKARQKRKIASAKTKAPSKPRTSSRPAR
jgi:hypothetical protein